MLLLMGKLFNLQSLISLVFKGGDTKIPYVNDENFDDDESPDEEYSLNYEDYDND